MALHLRKLIFGQSLTHWPRSWYFVLLWRGLWPRCLVGLLMRSCSILELYGNMKIDRMRLKKMWSILRTMQGAEWVSKVRGLHLVEGAADQPQLGPERSSPCLYWIYLMPFPSSLPQNLLSLSLTSSIQFRLSSDICSVFSQWCVWAEKSDDWWRASTVQLSRISGKNDSSYIWLFFGRC